MRKYQKSRRRRTAPPFLLTILMAFAIVGFLTANGFLTGRAGLLERLPFGVRTAGLEHGWNLILVNAECGLPRGWENELTELSNGQRVDSRIYPALQQMFDDMRAQGVYPVVASGYRTAEKQRELVDEKVEGFLAQGISASDAKTEALKWVAAVGHSEHQTGLAVDINADGVHSYGQQVYDWLKQNAWRYGFILRYPADKTEITQTDYEPWHYRYVGEEAAAEMQETGVCLEEYVLGLNGAAGG